MTASIDAPVKVTFMMWGQKCETVCESETEALRWLSVMSGKGWLMAESIIAADGTVLREGDQLVREVDQ